MELTTGFILHQSAYRESSSLVDVMTQDYGRVRLVARGIRQKRKRQQSFPQLFQPFQVSWLGAGELVTLKHFEVTAPAYLLRGNASFYGLYMNELLIRLLPLYEAEPAIYVSYQRALSALHHVEEDEVTLRLFEKHLLSHLGYGLELDKEAETGTILQDDRQYLYQLDKGPCVTYSNTSQKTISGRSLRHLREEAEFDTNSLQEIKSLMRQVLDYYLGGKPLKSRQLFTQLQQLKQKSEI